MKIKDILTYLENRFPYELAADFDKNKIGLTIGNLNNDVNGVLCALDLTVDVIEEAVNNNCNLIVSHHPFIFSPITKVLENDEKGALIYKMIKNNISLIAMHTNMDLGKDGVADTLCTMLSMKESNYGIHTTNEYARFGVIDKVSLESLANKIKNTFRLDGVKVVGDLNTEITKIGILGGSGGHESDILNAVNNNCQCYITGEIKHNVALMANYYNLCLIEVNHGIEKYVFDKLAIDIEKEFDVKTIVSNMDSNLFKFI